MRATLLVLLLAVSLCVHSRLAVPSKLSLLQGRQTLQQVVLQPDTADAPPAYVPATTSAQFDQDDSDQWWELRSQFPDPQFMGDTYEDAYDRDDYSEIVWNVNSGASPQES